MAILVASGKSLKLGKTGDHFYIRDVFESNDIATVSAGRLKWEKGYLLKDWTDPFHDLDYILKGSVKIESEGETYVAHEGDFVLITKGSKVTISTDEESEALFVTFPIFREVGTPGGI